MAVAALEVKNSTVGRKREKAKKALPQLKSVASDRSILRKTDDPNPSERPPSKVKKGAKAAGATPKAPPVVAVSAATPESGTQRQERGPSVETPTTTGGNSGTRSPDATLIGVPYCSSFFLDNLEGGGAAGGGGLGPRGASFVDRYASKVAFKLGQEGSGAGGGGPVKVKAGTSPESPSIDTVALMQCSSIADLSTELVGLRKEALSLTQQKHDAAQREQDNARQVAEMLRVHHNRQMSTMSRAEEMGRNGIWWAYRQLMLALSQAMLMSEPSVQDARLYHISVERRGLEHTESMHRAGIEKQEALALADITQGMPILKSLKKETADHKLSVQLADAACQLSVAETELCLERRKVRMLEEKLAALQAASDEAAGRAERGGEGRGGGAPEPIDHALTDYRPEDDLSALIAASHEAVKQRMCSAKAQGEVCAWRKKKLLTLARHNTKPPLPHRERH